MQPETDPMEAFVTERPDEPGLSEEDINLLLGTGELPAEPPKAEEVPAEQPAATKEAPASAAPAAAPEPEAAPTPQPEVAQVLLQKIAELEARIAAQPATSEAPPAEKPPEIPAYAYRIPDEVMAELEHDERPRRAHALSWLMSQVAQRVHATLVKETEGLVSKKLESFSGDLTVRQQQEELRRDYFSAFPAHNKPELMPVIAMLAGQVQREMNNPNWTPEVRNAVGARVNALLGTKGAAPTSPATSAPPPPPLASASSRPPAPAGTSQAQRLIDETLNF